MSLEERVMKYLAQFLDVRRYGGKVVLVHVGSGEVRIYGSISDARRDALGFRGGVVLIIPVPSEGEVGSDFIRFMRYVGSKH
ncbi:hypothetical protein [Vulcanisaeta thermophila]|uniref:hypothetical protein n=1 Tax=Vulcanisaeta thermophila TaxID=867917 RepID=UPI000852B5EC|nr:hypothetical protein [Vulcanisaeta thermophila]